MAAADGAHAGIQLLEYAIQLTTAAADGNQVPMLSSSCSQRHFWHASTESLRPVVIFAADASTEIMRPVLIFAHASFKRIVAATS